MKPIFLLGATASGKHELAVALAERLGAEIVSIDSMKVYRGMDIGTAKPTPRTLARIPHRLIDICDPAESYDAGRFVADARRAQAEIETRGKRVLFVGGTALYYKTYVYGLFEAPSAEPDLRNELVALGAPRLHEELRRVDPTAARRIHPNDLKRLVRAIEIYRQTGEPISAKQTQFDRPKIDAVSLCVSWERESLKARIAERTKRMLAAGLVDEVRRLLERPWGKEGRRAVGYREIVDHLAGKYDLAEAERLINRNSATFARRQLAWFRSFKELKWVAPALEEVEASCVS